MTHPQLFAPLRPKVQTGSTVRLINTYRGVPITSEATILAQGENFLKLGVSKYQAVCLEITRQTFLKCTGVPVLSAEVVEMDLAGETTVLAGFSPAVQNINARSTIRVEPREAIQLILWNEDSEQCSYGELADISATGMGIYVISIRLGAQHSISEGGEINVQLKLPYIGLDQTNSITLRGRVVYNLYSMEFPYLRLGLHLFPDADASRLISQYIAERQREIFLEVKTLYMLLRQLDSHNPR